IKYDGYRATAVRMGEKVAVLGRGEQGRKGIHSSKRRGDLSCRFPEIHAAIAALGHDVILDGEIVGFDTRGHAARRELYTPKDRRFVAFDLLYLDGVDLRKKPLKKRLELLRQLIEKARDPKLVLAEEVEGRASGALGKSWERRDEGIVSKDDES